MNGYISRMSIRLDATLSEIRHKGILQLDGYNIHKTVWNMMGLPEGSKRNFVFRLDQDREGLPEFTIVSETPPCNVDSIWSVQVKDYHPLIRTEERLQFTLRFQPLKALLDIDKARKGIRGGRVDMVLEARQADALAQNVRGSSEVHSEVACNWLLRREQQSGFRIDPDDLVVHRYSIAPHPKHAQIVDREQSQIKLSTMDVRGSLTVTDNQAFLTALFKGVGRGRTWGCGLLLVRRS